MSQPPVIESRPDTPRTCESWRSGGLRFDHSGDVELAEAGDEDAKARLRTQQRLALAKLSETQNI